MGLRGWGEEGVGGRRLYRFARYPRVASGGEGGEDEWHLCIYLGGNPALFSSIESRSPW